MKDNISNNPLEALQEIKKVMQQSSRIFSLSGWSGVWAGIVALIGTWWFWFVKNNYGSHVDYCSEVFTSTNSLSGDDIQGLQRLSSSFYLDTVQKDLLFWSALVIFSIAVIGAVFFSYRKNKKNGFNVNYNDIVRKLLINLAIPIGAGAMFCLHFLNAGLNCYLVPFSLVFYGLALINCSKYTFTDIKYLGLVEILLGLAALLLMRWHLVFWGLGFGVFHIVYGILMWYKYDKK